MPPLLWYIEGEKKPITRRLWRRCRTPRLKTRSDRTAQARGQPHQVKTAAGLSRLRWLSPNALTESSQTTAGCAQTPPVRAGRRFRARTVADALGQRVKTLADGRDVRVSPSRWVIPRRRYDAIAYLTGKTAVPLWLLDVPQRLLRILRSAPTFSRFNRADSFAASPFVQPGCVITVSAPYVRKRRDSAVSAAERRLVHRQRRTYKERPSPPAKIVIRRTPSAATPPAHSIADLYYKSPITTSMREQAEAEPPSASQA